KTVPPRLDRALAGRAPAPSGALASLAPFEGPATLSKARRRRLEELLDRLVDLGLDPTAVERLGDFVATAPPQEVARIRPLVLARRLRLDPHAPTAARPPRAPAGLLGPFWGIFFSVGRIPSGGEGELRGPREHRPRRGC